MPTHFFPALKDKLLRRLLLVTVHILLKREKRQQAAAYLERLIPGGR